MRFISKERSSPPKAPLALRVGVVGHRPNRLERADLSRLSNVIRKILDEIKDEVGKFQVDSPGLYWSNTPLVRAISPLAEGTDRIFAEQAIDAGYELCCIMPFQEEEFIKDFEPARAQEANSLQRFHSILERAMINNHLVRFELDGNRTNDPLAYANCSKALLNQSDLLVVVWDGFNQGKHGGTEYSLAEAHRLGIPVIWIDACEDHAYQLIKPGDKFLLSSPDTRKVPTGEVFSIKNLVYGLICLADEENQRKNKIQAKKPNQRGEKTNLEIFYTRHKPILRLAVFWNCFRDIFGDGRFPRPEFMLHDFEAAVKEEWPEGNSDPVARMVNTLRPYYAWPDKLAVLYSDRYRSAFIITFLLAALAVGMALLPIAGGWTMHTQAEIICIAIEMLMIVLIIGNVYFGRRNNWHERWIDYRLIAESIRHLRLVAPLGGGRPFLQPPAHLKTYGQPESTWVAWYVRAVERYLGVPSVVVNQEHLLASLSQLSVLIDSQILYHNTNSRRCSSIDHKLHKTGLFLLVLTFVSCIVHFVTSIWLNIFQASWLLPRMMTFFCGFLPALSAAMAGINNQGEFTRISKRSEAMHDQLEIIKQRVENLKNEILKSKEFPEEPFSMKTAEIISKTARLLTNEVLDWRVVFLDRPLNASV